MKLVRLSAFMLALAMLPGSSEAEGPLAGQRPVLSADAIIGELKAGLAEGAADRVPPWSEAATAGRFKASRVPAESAAAVWTFMADDNNAAVRTPAIVKALIAASDTPQSREAMFGELAGSASDMRREHRWRIHEQSLVGFFERNRAALLAQLGDLRETEPSCDAIIQLMQSSRVFGRDLQESVAYVSERIPDAVARYIENERGLGRRVAWEFTAYRSMLKWTPARFLPGAARPPRSLADLDNNGRVLITIFNSLQTFDEGIRSGALRGLDPAALFNAAIAGEAELYRVGTSGYQDVLHPAIMRGITEARSFEAFAESALPHRLVDDAAKTARDRRMAFLRITAHFGLLDAVLDTVRDRDAFADDLITALGDIPTFRSNSPVAMALLTRGPGGPVAAQFKAALLDRLYARYRTEPGGIRKDAYGSLLSVYQTMTGDRREAAIDRAFALEDDAFNIPFARLFSEADGGGLVHRMFMRMDSDDDAVGTYAAFGTLMRSLNATVREQTAFDVFEIAAAGRRIEIYANKPSGSGVRQGIAGIAAALKDLRVETVIGRGHTAIIEPLQEDAKRVLGHRLKETAAVIVGSCGGDAAVLDLIATFGYKPFVTTRSTGRQVINNAVIKSYIAALMALQPGDRLSMSDVLEAGTARFMRAGADGELRTDAGLYQVNMATVFTAQLYDTYLRRFREPEQRAALR